MYTYIYQIDQNLQTKCKFHFQSDHSDVVMLPQKKKAMVIKIGMKNMYSLIQITLSLKDLTWS